MRPTRQTTLVGLAVVAAIVGGAYAAKRLTEGSAASVHALPPAQHHLFTYINQERAARGLHLLRQDVILASLAAIHTRDELAGDYFAHDAPQGMTFGERVSYLHRSHVGEVLAWGDGMFGTSRGILSLWLNSAEHRRIILDPRMRRIGIAVLKGGPYRGQSSAIVATGELSS